MNHVRYIEAHIYPLFLSVQEKAGSDPPPPPSPTSCFLHFAVSDVSAEAVQMSSMVWRETFMNTLNSSVHTKVTSYQFNCTYSIWSSLTRSSLADAELPRVPPPPSPLIAVILMPKLDIFQVKFGVAMLGGDINLACDIAVVVMKDTRRYLYPRVSSVLSKVGEFCLPGRFVSSPGSHGPVRDSSCST